MSKITVKNLSQKFSSRQALKGVSLEIADKELTVVTGLKESGKTSFIRALCGLDAVCDGEIYLDGVLINKFEPRQRDMAVVTDAVPLNPNESVYDNMAAGMKLRKFPKEEIDSKVKKAADILGLTDYVRRLTKNLTPGQRQRVYLARAIAREPKIVIIDSNYDGLDKGLKKELQNEIVKLNRRLKINFIYVTDDPGAALTMADKIMFLEGGVLTQYGTPTELYNTPSTLPIARFFGSPKINLMQGALVEADGKVFIETEGLKMEYTAELSAEAKATYLGTGKKITAAFRAEDITAAEDGELNFAVDGCDKWTDNISVAVLHSALIESPTYINALITAETGGEVKVNINKEHLLIYDTETENIIL